MYFDYLTALVFCMIGVGFVFVNLLVASVIRPSRKTDEGLETYECGEETIGDAWIQFDIRYYTVALVYVVFAVEIAFLFPWALVLGDTMRGTGAATGMGVGWFGLVEGFLFIAILFLGLAYVWAKGDLDWVLAYSGERWEPKQRRGLPRLAVHELAAGDEAPESTEGEDAENATEPEPEPAA